MTQFLPPPETDLQEEPDLRRRRLLLALTLLWLPVAVTAALILSGRWLLDPDLALARALLWALFVIQTLLVIAGWAVAGWQTRTQSRLDREAQHTLTDLQALSPSAFEIWVQRLFESRGYFAHNTPDQADHGIDLLVVSPQGEPGVVQCKRYRGNVGEPAVRDLYGVMGSEGASHGFLVTTGGFSRAARRWAQGKPIELIDGRRLIRLASQFPVSESALKRQDA